MSFIKNWTNLFDSETIIRLTGWGGFTINLVAILTYQLPLLLIGQLVSAISAFLWSRFLQRKVTWDLIGSLLLTAMAAITGEQFWLFAAMLCRSFSYQLVFERVVKERQQLS